MKFASQAAEDVDKLRLGHEGLPVGEVCNIMDFFVTQTISSRTAGPGELFSSDFQACVQSPRWATCCSFAFGSVSCSCDAAPRTAVRKRAHPVASSPLSEQRRT